MSQRRLTKRERRLMRQKGIESIDKAFDMKKVHPLTDTQRDAFECWEEGQHLFLHGTAGTGKSFLGLYFALQAVASADTPYRKVYIVRSAVPSRDMGFLPGNQTEKMRVYEQPYTQLCNKLYGRGDAYEILKHKEIVEFIPTSFVRGSEFNDCIVLVDECQNMDAMELHTVMTRAGEDCRFVFAGDMRQDDLTSIRKKEQSGVQEFMRIIAEMDYFDLINFGPNDIVRSDIVKQYIIARERLGID